MIKRSCKYFRKSRNAFIYCEAARLNFRDRRQRDDYCRAYCNKSDEYNACPIRQSLDDFYRKCNNDV